MLVLPNEQKIS